MEICLIAPGRKDRIDNSTLRLLKSMLEKDGHEVSLIYLNIVGEGEKTSAGSLNDKLKEEIMKMIESSDIVGLNVYTFDFYLSVEITKLIGSKSNALILWGGPHAIAMPEECVQHADIVCINEGEEALIEIIKGYKKDGAGFDKNGIPNIAYKKNGSVKYNAIKPLSFSLDTLPYQDYSLVKHYYVNEEDDIVPLTFDVIKGAEGQGLNYITMISRGCLFKCTYCLNSNENSIQYSLNRSVDNIIGELKHVQELYGDQIEKISFYDDDLFSLPIEYTEELCVNYKEQIGLPIHPVSATFATFSEEKLILLKNAGITGIILGIQTISKNGKRTYHHPATKEKVVKFINIMKKYPDLSIGFHLIIGNPYETQDDIAENLLFLNSLPKIFHLTTQRLTIFPGTKLYERVKNDPIHKVKINEAYYLPSGYRTPELRMWFLLCMKITNKEKFPLYTEYLMKKKQYLVLKFILYSINVYSYFKQNGLISVINKIKEQFKWSV